ncbi:MAG: nitroreductase family protein [Candidatus Zixiibacteriota bacterium]
MEEMRQRAEAFYAEMKRRRSVREFSERPVPHEIIENCLRAASTAPSGANMQPWHFVVVSDPTIKKHIREAAEKVEADFYHRRAPEHWLEELEPLGTDEHKPFLEEAPYLIAIFSQRYSVAEDGTIIKHYYPLESVGIAVGMLITAIHHVGLVCLTYTPTPMSFLRDILKRPKHETPFLLLVVGYPKKGAVVPNLKKKNLDEIATFV